MKLIEKNMKKMKCRYCENELSVCMCDLGMAPLSNDYIEEEKLGDLQTTLPLSVYFCENCGLIQVLNYEAPSGVFNEHYKYFSSFSSTWLKHCKEYVDHIVEKLSLNSFSKVMEIASNDGYLLQYFKEYSINPLGIEPSNATADIARQKGIETLEEFFNYDFAEKLVDIRGHFDLIIGNNVLAHVPNIRGFVQGLKVALNEGGTITLEFPHVLNLIKYNQFDTIYHEHYSYLNILTLNRIFNEHQLKIYEVKKLSTHGGSLRIYATHENNIDIMVDDSVEAVIQEEKAFGLEKPETYLLFNKKTIDMKIDIWRTLIRIHELGKTVVGYGAAAKGNTLFNYCGIKNDLIEYVTDASPYKQGLYLPGSKIPILKPEVIKETKPDYVLIIPWNIKDEIINELQYIREWGGKFITLIPSVRIF